MVSWCDYTERNSKATERLPDRIEHACSMGEGWRGFMPPRMADRSGFGGVFLMTHRIRVGMTKSIRAYGGCLGVERR